MSRERKKKKKKNGRDRYSRTERSPYRGYYGDRRSPTRDGRSRSTSPRTSAGDRRRSSSRSPGRSTREYRPDAERARSRSRARSKGRQGTISDESGRRANSGSDRWDREGGEAHPDSEEGVGPKRRPIECYGCGGRHKGGQLQCKLRWHPDFNKEDMPWGASAAGQWYHEYGHKRLVPDMHLVYDEGSTKWLIKPLNPAIAPPGKKGKQT